MITNKYNLPEYLVNALTVKHYPPQPGRISVTQLIEPPLKRLLLMKYADEIVEDVSDNLWALLGRAVHYIIEKSGSETEIKIAEDYGGATIVGVIDCFTGTEIIDWKLVTKWAAVFSDGKDWEKQLQTYGFLAKRFLNRPVEQLSIYMILRDWNKREAQRNPTQPQIPFQMASFAPWSGEKAERYVSIRTALHLSAERDFLESGTVPEKYWCNDDERWHKEDSWAVKKDEKAPRAKRVFKTQEEAIAYKGKGDIIEFRLGEDTRCKDYCNVSPWCPYYQEIIKDKK